MAQSYRTTDVVAYLRSEWEAASDPIASGLADRLLRMVADRFPGILGHRALKALEAFDHELTAEDEAAEQENAALAAAIAICERHGVPAHVPMGEGLALAASRGDAEAAAILAKAEADAASPANRIREALADAACRAHPAWSEDEDGFYLEEGRDGPVSDTDLIDWYQRTYPREASAIEAQVKAGNPTMQPNRDQHRRWAAGVMSTFSGDPAVIGVAWAISAEMQRLGVEVLEQPVAHVAAEGIYTPKLISAVMRTLEEAGGLVRQGDGVRLGRELGSAAARSQLRRQSL